MAAAGGQALRVLEVYTDGAVKRPKQKAAIGPWAPSGCAFVARDRDSDPWLGRFYALGPQFDSQHVEMLGMFFALQYLAGQAQAHGQTHQEVFIYSDCSFALEEIAKARNNVTLALGKPKFVSHILSRILGFLHILEGNFDTPVRFAYVPGHASIPGNTEADDAAGRGADLSRQGYAAVGWPEGGPPSLTSFPVSWP